MHSWVQQILSTPEVVCCVIHAKGVVFVNAVVYEYESIALLHCKQVLIAVVFVPK